MLNLSTLPVRASVGLETGSFVTCSFDVLGSSELSVAMLWSWSVSASGAVELPALSSASFETDIDTCSLVDAISVFRIPCERWETSTDQTARDVIVWSEVIDVRK